MKGAMIFSRLMKGLKHDTQFCELIDSGLVKVLSLIGKILMKICCQLNDNFLSASAQQQ